MSWNVYFFGKENPSFRRKIAFNSVMGGMGLCIYGMWTDFIPSITWTRWGFYLSVAIALTATICLYWGYATGRIEMQNGISILKKAFALLVLPFMLFGAFWLVLVKGLPDIVTQMIGNPHSESVMLVKEHRNSRYSCDYRLKGEVLDRAYPSYVCISSSYFDALPVGPVEAKIVGSISIFGFHVRRVYRGNANMVNHQDTAFAMLW